MNLIHFVGSITGVLLFNSITFAASDKPVEVARLSLNEEVIKVQPNNQNAKKDLFGPFKLQNSQSENNYNKTALKDLGENGSEGDDSALGLNLHINPNVSFTADYVSMQYKPFVIEVDDGKGGDDLSLFQTRIQLKFY